MSVTINHVSARLNRQVLRWLIQKHAPLSDNILGVLRTMLGDPDWEVRVTAMFAAGRLGASRLRSVVERVSIPSGNREGLDALDRNMLVAARQVIVAQLNGLLTPDQFASTVDRMPGVPIEFARAVIGLPVERQTRESLFITSLTVPAETDGFAPDVLPAGVVAEAGQYFLADTGIELMWVAPIPHWLGDDSSALPTPNPIRHIASARGFFIARRPVSALRAHAHESGPVTSPPLKPEYLMATFSAAQQLCESFGTLAGATVVLPTADQWEMAARGPDGRRFPAGNGLSRDLLKDCSPWGVYESIGIAPQWTSSTDESGRPFVCGQPPHLRCSARSQAREDQTAAVRPVVWSA